MTPPHEAGAADAAGASRVLAGATANAFRLATADGFGAGVGPTDPSPELTCGGSPDLKYAAGSGARSGRGGPSRRVASRGDVGLYRGAGSGTGSTGPAGVSGLNRDGVASGC